MARDLAFASVFLGSVSCGFCKVFSSLIQSAFESIGEFVLD